MTRRTKRRLSSVFLVVLGLALVLPPLVQSSWPTGAPNARVFYGLVLLVTGVLGLAGFEAVFRSGPLDPRFDPDREPSPEEFVSSDRVGAQPDLGAQECRLPLRFSVLPQRCANCGQPAARAWPVEAKRGFDFIIAYAYQAGVLGVPLCGGCHRRRRALQWLARALPALSFGVWMVLAPVGLGLLSAEVATVAGVCFLGGRNARRRSMVAQRVPAQLAGEADAARGRTSECGLEEQP